MTMREVFQLLNSRLWLNYTHQRYVPLNDIQYRLDKLGLKKADWPSLKKKIQATRKMGSIPFFLHNLNKKFWYFPSDSIHEKVHRIEKEGMELYNKIEAYGKLKEEFLTSTRIEEAITSALYEGANSTRSAAKKLIASNKAPKNKDEWQLINNYQTMRWIKENHTLPMSKELILKIHENISKNTLEGDDINFCGKFRNDTVYVGIKHEGTDYKEISKTIDTVIELIEHHGRAIHKIIKGVLFHYFIAYIHPFFDGNGRTARNLFYFKSMQSQLKIIELLSISADLKAHGKKYERSFDLVIENELDMTFFIDFSLDSLCIAIEKVKEKINYLMKIANLGTVMKINQDQILLLQKKALNKFSPITIEEYANNIQKSREHARKELKYLLEKKFLLEEVIGKKFFYRVDSKYLKKIVKEIK